ncbi:hypothetical protein ACFL3T_00410 [Patescibacteria group bacterium]
MKKLFAICLLFVLTANVALAADFYGEEELYLKTVSEDDVYAGGGLVTVDETINGDLLIGGGSVTINANVNGDLFVVGGQITINGDVSDDVRAAGGTIILNGNVGDDVIATSGQLNISSNSLIGGSLIMGNGMANVLGSINEDIIGGGGKLILGGTVYRDVNVEIQDSITLTSDARINGNLIYSSLREAELTEDQVAGFIEYNKTVVEDDYGNQIENMFSRFHLVIQLLKYLSLLLIGFILVFLVPKSLLDASKVSKTHPWRSLGLGFVIAICSIAAMIVLAITIIGVPLAGILLGLFLISWYVAKVFAAMFVGYLLLKPKKNTKWTLFGMIALGGFILVIIGLVPIIGALLAFLITMLSFGSVWTYKKQLYDKEDLRKI